MLAWSEKLQQYDAKNIFTVLDSRTIEHKHDDPASERIFTVNWHVVERLSTDGIWLIPHKLVNGPWVLVEMNFKEGLISVREEYRVANDVFNQLCEVLLEVTNKLNSNKSFKCDRFPIPNQNDKKWQSGLGVLFAMHNIIAKVNSQIVPSTEYYAKIVQENLLDTTEIGRSTLRRMQFATEPGTFSTILDLKSRGNSLKSKQTTLFLLTD